MRKFIHLWLNFTSGERKGIIILAIICFAALSVRWWFPVPHYTTQISDDSLQHVVQLLRVKEQVTVNIDSVMQPFRVADADSVIWVKAGLSPFQARTLTRYLSKGGKLRDTSDLWKLYFMDSSIYKHLSHLIVFESSTKPEKEEVDKFRNETQSHKKVNKIELNAADSMQLVSISGIGPVFASRIIRYRKLLGGYTSLLQLKEVYGFSEHFTPNLVSQLVVDSTLVVRININKATFVELMRHPYLGKTMAQEITKARRKKTLNKEDLRNIVKPETLCKIDSYVVF
jgi:DNA uptake protein ComE-like DNA-binding protein